MVIAKTLFFLFGTCIILVGCAKSRSIAQGVNGGRLAPCPDSPNCVSSQSTNKKQRVEPIPFKGTSAEALAKLRNVIQSMKRAKIVKEEDDYLHAEFRSALFGFVDDVEFLVEAETNVIHVRSASRTGYSDFGVNRKRVETIRSKLSGN
jgi:uncharacterized protein (DUF1499 family)